ncbi:hypothetical protein PO909_029773 [Leuciscus waleckii]
MSKRYTAEETLQFLLQASDNEAFSEAGDSSGTEDASEVDPDFQVTEDQPLDDSEDDSEEEGHQGEPSFQSKNGEIIWSSSPPLQTAGRARAEEIITKTPGPTRYAIARSEDVKSTFELYFPHSIQTILVTMTNMEGNRVYGDQWKKIDWTELEAFMGLLILAGVLKSNGESARSLWDGEMGRAIFRATMPLKDFIKLSGVIRFDDKATRNERKATDKLAPIRELWDKWLERLPLMYNPGMYVTVDECLIGFRGRCQFRQYMPSKPAKYGLKIWAACDAKSSYSHNMQVYTGKPAGGQREQHLGKRVVLDMVKDLKGHIVTCDNFFTSYALGSELLQRKIRMLGTVRKNRAELPSALLTVQNRSVHSSLFGFTETHTIVSYSPQKKKNVILMSTVHNNAAVSDREDRKPMMILDYNATKGGVDNLDKIVATYTCARKTARWPMAIFFYILDVSAYNSFVLWREINPTWGQLKSYKRRLFLEELGKALVYPFMKRRQHIPRTLASVSFLKSVKDSRDEEAGPSSSLSAGPPTAASSSSSTGPPTAASSAGPPTAASSSSSTGPPTAASSAGPPTAASSSSSAGPPTAASSSSSAGPPTAASSSSSTGPPTAASSAGPPTAASSSSSTGPPTAASSAGPPTAASSSSSAGPPTAASSSSSAGPPTAASSSGPPTAASSSSSAGPPTAASSSSSAGPPTAASSSSSAGPPTAASSSSSAGPPTAASSSSSAGPPTAASSSSSAGPPTAASSSSSAGPPTAASSSSSAGPPTAASSSSSAGPPTAASSSSSAGPPTAASSAGPPTAASSAGACRLVHRQQDKRKRCKMCWPEDVKTSNICKKYKFPVCKKHLVTICEFCNNW